MAPLSPSSIPASAILTLDQQIHDLLMRRAEALEVLAREHGESGGIIGFRPAQDAAELRRLVERHSGSFPLRAVVRIWREIQAASFSEHGRYEVHVYAGENARAFWDLARAYFGSTLPLTGHATVSAVVHACAEDARALGVVPFPESADTGSPWWAQLASAGEAGPRVIARLPLLDEDGGRFEYPRAYAIGTIAQEPTGDDTSVLFLETGQELSRARLQTLLRQVGIEARIVAAGQEPGDTLKRSLLLEATAFIAPNDSRLAALMASGGEAILRAVPVGGYANPLRCGQPQGPQA